jgi:hypothetical protein
MEVKMPASRSFRVKAVWLLCLAALLIAMATALVACGGGNDFEGTWVKEGEEGAMVIKKADDGYDVTIKAKESDESGFTLKATEDGDKLVIKDPTGETQEMITMTVDGDKLTMKSGDETQELTRK